MDFNKDTLLEVLEDIRKTIIERKESYISSAR